jgi:hypothetical protein
MESYSDILLYVNILDFQEIFKTHICKGKEHCHIFNVESIVEDHPITLHTYFVEDHPGPLFLRNGEIRGHSPT